MARANPHRKNSDVTSMNGKRYCRLVNVERFIVFLLFVVGAGNTAGVSGGKPVLAAFRGRRFAFAP